jgi:hypothetical protein
MEIEEWSSFFAPTTKEDKALSDWFHARSIFLGTNNEDQNVELGIQLASQCTTVPDAVWLCSLFPNGPPKTREEAFTVLKGTLDSRSIGYRAYFLQCHFIMFMSEIERAATLGSIIAQAEWLYYHYHDTIFPYKNKWIHDTLQAQEPRALNVKAKISDNHNEKCYYLLRAVRLGSMNSIFEYAWRYLDDINPERYAALLFCTMHSYVPVKCTDECNKCIIAYMYGKFEYTNVVYRIGSLLVRYPTLPRLCDGDVAISLFNSWTQIVKSSVVNWQLSAKTLGICKDIRLLIARLIWNDRWNVKK